MKKGFILFMALAMVLSYSVVMTGSVRAASDGDLIKMAGHSAVYYLNGGKRYVFPNEKTYKTWFSDFSGVITVSQSEMESYPLGGNVTYRPGTRLVKIDTVPTVYAVEPGGVLRSIVSEDNAKALYGDDWNKRIDDVPDAFWVNYTIGSPLAAGKYPTGTLVKEEGSSTTYYIDGDTKRPIVSAEAFEANNFNWAFLVIASDLSGYTDGPSITGAEPALMTVAGPATGSSSTAAGSVTVALSASTAPAATVISDTAEGAQALIPFVTVDFTAPSSGDVVVTNLKYKRTGISADSDINALYIYDGNTFLAEGGSISSGYVTFNDPNGLFTVPAGTTKSVTLKADLVENTSAGKTIAFQLEDVSTKNGATVSGSLPITGNIMTTASVTDLGYVTYTAGNVPTSAQTVDPGETDFEMYKIGLTANDQDLKLEYVKFTLLGSVNTDDLQNLKLKVGGTEIASGTINSDRELVFDLTSNPYLIEKGQSKTFSLRGDVVKGSTRTFRWSIENSRDLVLLDANYNVDITPYGSASNSWSAKKSSSSSYVYTISSGSLAVSLDTSSPTDNVPAGATNVKLATYKFEATGEDIKVKTLNIRSVASAPGTVNNVKVLVDGVQVGSTQDITYSGDGTQFSFGSSFIVPAGESVLVDIYGDIKDADGNNYDDGDTIKIVLDAGSGDNAIGQESLTSLDVPSSDLSANTLTVSEASISLIAYSGYGNQNIVKPATQAKVGSFVISAGAYEGITIDTINIDNATSGVMQNMKLIDHDSGVQYGSTKVTLTSSNSTDNVFSINNLDLAAGESRVIDVYADIKSSTGANSVQIQVGAIGSSDITGITKYHNSSSDGDADVSLQTMTITTGSIAATADGSQPDSDIIIAGTTATMNAIKFTASNEAYKVTKLLIKDSVSGTYDSVAKVIIEYPNESGSTVTAEAYLDASGNAYFYNLDFYIPKDDTAVLTVKAEIPTISTGADSGDMPRLDFDYNTSFSATGQSSNTVENSVGSSDVTGNAMVVRKTRPTITEVSLPTQVLTNGEMTLAKFTIAADSAADVYFKELNFSYATTDGVGLSNVYLYETGNTTALNSAATPDTVNKTIEVVLTNEETVAAGTSVTYELKGTVSGASTNDSIYVTMGSSASSSYAGTSTTYALLKLYETGGILWSDGSVTPHTSSSADYADCNYVKNLPITFDTLSY